MKYNKTIQSTNKFMNLLCKMVKEINRLLVPQTKKIKDGSNEQNEQRTITRDSKEEIMTIIREYCQYL